MLRPLTLTGVLAVAAAPLSGQIAAKGIDAGSTTLQPDVPPPADLTCTVTVEEWWSVQVYIVHLAWRNPVAYDEIQILRNGDLKATLEGSPNSYSEKLFSHGQYKTYDYTVIGILKGERKQAPPCSVDVPPGPVPPPAELGCDGGDWRGVVLTWSNPARYDSIEVTRDGQLIAKFAWTAMVYIDRSVSPGKHRYGVKGIGDNGKESLEALCDVVVGDPVSPVEDFNCFIPHDNADAIQLTWRNEGAYDNILVCRWWQPPFVLDGSRTDFLDDGLRPRPYRYKVVAVANGRRSKPKYCSAFIGGRQGDDIVFFSADGLPGTSSSDRPRPANRIACLLSNSSEVEAWSFSIQSDPAFVVPARYDFEGTVTSAFHGGASADFLTVDGGKDGVTMNVIIENAMNKERSVSETLPPCTAQPHPLINIEYEAGPDGEPGVDYPIAYSGAVLTVNGTEVRPDTLPGIVTLPGDRFRRGDANADDATNISDVLAILGYLYLGIDKVPCDQAGDVNDDGFFNITDAIHFLNFMFLGGKAIEPPVGACGIDPTGHSLPCGSFPACP